MGKEQSKEITWWWNNEVQITIKEKNLALQLLKENENQNTKYKYRQGKGRQKKAVRETPTEFGISGWK